MLLIYLVLLGNSHQAEIVNKTYKKLCFISIFVSLALGHSSYAFGQVDTVPSEEASIPQNRIVLRALDKITARITEFELQIGDELRFGTLAIRAKYCRTRPPIELPETFAYLEVDDLNRSGERERVFDGWMVASSPALNALEHPVYDVWVLSCKMVDPDTLSAN